MKRNFVEDVREGFVDQLQRMRLVGQKPNQTIELHDASFIADEPTIFGKVSEEYVAKELKWYLEMDLCIDGLGPNIPQIWQQIASRKRMINSNYGWCIYSEANGNQFDNAVYALVKDPHSRQAMMLYTRPSMHVDAFRDGMRDFMCTTSVQLLLRDNVMMYIVHARSTDAVFGYKNDFAWHNFVFDKAIVDYRQRSGQMVEKGHLFYNVGSLHVYSRHFDLVEAYAAA